MENGSNLPWDRLFELKGPRQGKVEEKGLLSIFLFVSLVYCVKGRRKWCVVGCMAVDIIILLWNCIVIFAMPNHG